MEYLVLITVVLGGIIIWRLMSQKAVPTISFEQLMTDATYKNYQRIDVRTKQEFSSQRLARFQNIPLNELEQKLAKIDQTKPVAVMCASGMRSAQAAKILQKHHYQVVNLKGGIHAAPNNFR